MILSLALVGPGCTREAAGPPPGGGPPPLPVQVIEAAQQTFPIEIQAVGSLRSPETTLVAADESGILVYLDAPEGRAVNEGHLIARLDDAEATAARSVAEARDTNARAALERIQPLFEDGVVSRQAFDDAVAERNTAQGLLEEARTMLGKTRIVAPFSGILGLQTAQRGQYVSSGQAIVELTRVDPLELIFNVPEDDASEVALGQIVYGRVGRCGIAFEGTVEAIDPTLDRATRTLAVQARVANRERRLRPGMSARVALRVGEQEGAIVVPREALTAQGTQYQVWVVRPAEPGTKTGGETSGPVFVAQPQPIDVGRFHADGVEVRGGLSAGDRLVAAGHQKLRPGSFVIPTPWQPTDNRNLRLGASGPDDCEPAPALGVTATPSGG